jgi:NADPH-dependent 2,4-dienoyl-CoA reductase/sulfur reductase-like enzyme
MVRNRHSQRTLSMAGGRKPSSSSAPDRRVAGLRERCAPKATRRRIVLIGDEPHPPYERPPLSKAVLAGETAPQKTYIFPADALAGLDLTMRPGARAARIDRAARRWCSSRGSASATTS